MTGTVGLAGNDAVLTPDMAQVEASAERELGELLRSGAPASEGTAAEPPPETQSQPETPPEAQPDQTVAAKGEESPSVTSPPSVEDESVKRYESMYGGDRVAAAKAALETNTRAAQMATKLRELGFDPKTGQPLSGAVERRTEQTSPPLADERTVQGHVNQILDSDPVFSGYVQEFVSNKGLIEGVSKERSEVERSLNQAKFALEIPQVKADPLEVDRYNSHIDRMETKLLQLDLKKSNLEGRQERLDVLATQRANLTKDAVHRELNAVLGEREERAAHESLVSEYRAEFAVAFPNAIDKAIKDFKIPQSEVDDFKADVRARALAAVALDTSDPIEDVYGFVSSAAKVLMDRYDRYHRGKSAEYAKAAQSRTATATSTAPPAAPVTQSSTPEQHKSLYDYEQELAKEAALVAKQMGLFS